MNESGSIWFQQYPNKNQNAFAFPSGEPDTRSSLLPLSVCQQESMQHLCLPPREIPPSPPEWILNLPVHSRSPEDTGAHFPWRWITLHAVWQDSCTMKCLNTYGSDCGIVMPKYSHLMKQRENNKQRRGGSRLRLMPLCAFSYVSYVSRERDPRLEWLYLFNWDWRWFLLARFPTLTSVWI